MTVRESYHDYQGRKMREARKKPVVASPSLQKGGKLWRWTSNLLLMTACQS